MDTLKIIPISTTLDSVSSSIDKGSICDIKHDSHSGTYHNPNAFHTTSYCTNDTTTTSSYSALADTPSSCSATADSSSCFFKCCRCV